MLEHEIDHCAKFRAAMPERSARPCRIMSLWGLGGSVLGGATALLGRQSIWICTSAVESTVHRHLDDQLDFLQSRDEALHSIILDIREQELAHLDMANEHILAETVFATFMRGAIATITNALIWLSTWGDSSRLAATLGEGERGS